MDNSVKKAGEFIRITGLQSAMGDMALSVIGMIVAAAGPLNSVVGAITHEFIEVLAVLKALRGAFPPKLIHVL